MVLMARRKGAAAAASTSAAAAAVDLWAEVPSMNAAQRAAVAQFSETTQTVPLFAYRAVQKAGFRVERALGEFFDRPPALKPGDRLPPRAAAAPAASAAGKLFDALAGADGGDALSGDSFDALLGACGLGDADALHTVALQRRLGCAHLYEVTRAEFAAAAAAHALGDKAALAALGKAVRAECSTSGEAFGETYRAAFKMALAVGEKRLDPDTALAMWSQLLAETGRFALYALWEQFFAAAKVDGVNHDVWRLLLPFAAKYTSVESLRAYDEDSTCWPDLMDDFVDFALKRNQGDDDD